MSEMVERVAKAAQETARGMGSFFDNYVALEVARAAIEAMREPTIEMQRAGLGALDWQSDCNCDQMDCWQAMIDTALTSPSTSPLHESAPQSHPSLSDKP